MRNQKRSGAFFLFLGREKISEAYQMLFVYKKTKKGVTNGYEI
jgi:hypothetical protein